MKDKQEQIEEIVKILLESSKNCFDTDCDYCDKQYEKDCAQYRKAVALCDAGYGDVSEYKAEIERLKSDNEALTMWNEAYTEENEKLKEENKKLEEDIDMIIKEQKDDCKFDIKQAKIDVLNKVKTLIFQKDNPYNVPFEEFVSANVFCGYIDELIKEIENDETIC